MASNRFLMVPEDSSAARMPLPGVTIFSAIALSAPKSILNPSSIPDGGRSHAPPLSFAKG